MKPRAACQPRPNLAGERGLGCRSATPGMASDNTKSRETTLFTSLDPILFVACMWADVMMAWLGTKRRFLSTASACLGSLKITGLTPSPRMSSVVGRNTLSGIPVRISVASLASAIPKLDHCDRAPIVMTHNGAVTTLPLL